MTRSSPFESGIGPALVYFGFRIAAWLAAHMPRSIANRIAEVGGALWFRLARQKRSIVRRNLARVLGDGPHLEEAVRRAFDSYARYWLETFRVSSYSKNELVETVDSDTVHVLEEALAGGRGVVVATAHFGFYDVGVSWLGAKGIPMATVAEVLRPRALFEWFASTRHERGMEVIPSMPRDQARRRQIEILQNGGGLALLADRDLGRRGVWVTLFGERTTIPAGPALLVAKTGAPLIFGAIYMRGERYQVDFGRIPYTRIGDERRDVEVIAQVIADAVEGIVRKAPEQWHLFSTNWPADEPHLPPRGTREPKDAGA